MTEVKFYDSVEDSLLKFAVILAKSEGKWIFCKHKERDTYEVPGGHRETGEDISETAKRELYEETGAITFVIWPICVYSVVRTKGEQKEESFGMLFFAEVREFEKELHSEIEKIILTDNLVTDWTYPQIQPKLIEEAQRRGVFSKKRILYGTKNPAKLDAMKRRLSTLGLEVAGLRDVVGRLPEVDEDGGTPLENARKKAAAYYETLRMPVFSCDSGLYIDDIPQEEQPGVHVRTIGGKCLSDEEMLEHYTGLAKKYGNLTARYRNAICLILDDGKRYEGMDESMESEHFLITTKPHPMRKKGFPIDSISLDKKSGRYYYDMAEGELDRFAVEDGFLAFFKKYL